MRLIHSAAVLSAYYSSEAAGSDKALTNTVIAYEMTVMMSAMSADSWFV